MPTSLIKLLFTARQPRLTPHVRLLELLKSLAMLTLNYPQDCLMSPWQGMVGLRKGISSHRKPGDSLDFASQITGLSFLVYVHLVWSRVSPKHRLHCRLLYTHTWARRQSHSHTQWSCQEDVHILASLLVSSGGGTKQD